MKKFLLVTFLSMCLADVYSQSQMVLTFTGMDSLSQTLIPIDSLYVKNIDEQCDTMLYGPYLVFYLTANWPVGVNETATGSQGSIVIKQNYPNPFQGSTHVSVYKHHEGQLNLKLISETGIKLAEYSRILGKGYHSFEVSSSGNDVLILAVSDGKSSQSIKIISTGSGTGGSAIKYLGPGNGIEKSTAANSDIQGFIFYLGNEMMYTAYANGYHDKTIYDSPAGDTNYVITLDPVNFDVTPTVYTTPVTDITQTSATSGGNVISDGGAPVMARGVCWSTSPYPTILNSHTINGSGTGMFVSYISGLAPGTMYYLRAYATNVVGTGYGQQLNFTTLQNSMLPTVTTYPVSDITQTTATSGGIVTSSGGSSVSARGVCWSTSPDPTTADNHTLNGTGIGPFSSYVTGLTPNVLYYLRAYATNSQGTAYGNEMNFTTLPISIPTVYTLEVTANSATTAFYNGNVTSDGGSPVTARGVCWNTSPNPTTANSHTNDGTGTGNFTGTIAGLMANTTYYARTYATNSIGTAYGNEIMFNNAYWIGENYGGGIIFYIDTTWQHGLITSATDQGSGVQWGCPGVLVGASGSVLGSGQANTTAIVNGCNTPGIAAQICDALVLNGYNDWYLPSVDELYEMEYRQSYIGGFVLNEPYWTSTEFDPSVAYATSFPWGDAMWVAKVDAGHVRPIRSF